LKESSLLYLHIPFCDSKCHYCSFNSYVDRFELKERYMRAAHTQLRHDLTHYGIQKGSIETVFVGGGTPSTVDPCLYEPLFEAMSPYLREDAEITFEANPNSACSEWLEGVKKLGANRISFGVQSLFDDKLRLLGRAHRAGDAIAALERAAGTGFEHISADLIYATMLDTPERIGREVETLLALPIDHMSAYELTIEEGTPFEKMPEVRRESIEQTKCIREAVMARGWTQYEISNYGSYACRHNLGYWRYKPYLGIGSGAVGRIGTERLYPHRDVERYIAEPIFKSVERLEPQEILEEKIFLGLRSVVGIDEDILEKRMKARCELLLKEGKLAFGHGRYYNTDYLLSDEIALFILG